ncbi:MAG TPA: tetratricopeptide repeat protein [Gemmatimonadaceae bacterium]|nr:tetratricopeptide repeat protein [Gemmatimonadaceae bacterium]
MPRLCARTGPISVALLVISLARPALLAAQGDLGAFDRGMRAYAEGRWADAYADLRRAHEALPQHPGLAWTAARAAARAGQGDAAVALLRHVAAFGVDMPTADTAFAALRGDAAFQAVARELAAHAAPLVASDTAFVLPDPDLVPEALAHDRRDGAFYVGSLAKRKVVRVTRGAAARDFAGVRGDSLLPVLGLKVDAARGALWVNTARQAAGTIPGATALVELDLATGAVRARYVPADTGAHFFNDLVVAADGRVFLTDSDGGAVWRLDPGARTPVPLVPRGRFIYPNGIALAADGRVYVAHAAGLSVLDPATGRDAPVAAPPDVTTAGIDGLYAHGRCLVGVQGFGVGADRVIRLELDPSGRRVASARVLERAHPAYEAPTTGALVGDTLYYIANSQLRRLAPDGSLAPAAKPRPTVVLQLPVGCDG